VTNNDDAALALFIFASRKGNGEKSTKPADPIKSVDRSTAMQERLVQKHPIDQRRRKKGECNKTIDDRSIAIDGATTFLSLSFFFFLLPSSFFIIVGANLVFRRC
jgi:hypothetical protein